MELHLAQGPCGPGRVTRRSKRDWTDAKRAAFLDNLAATCNVKLSCEAVGMTTSGLYQLRLRDPGFAEQWRAALLVGYDRIEELAIRLATEALTRIELGEATEPSIDISSAIALMKMHDARAREKTARRRTPPLRRATEEETNAAIMKQLAALDARVKAKAAREAKAEAARAAAEAEAAEADGAEA